MNNQIKYNLSSIPGFNELIKTGKIISEYEKYYTSQQYSNGENQNYIIVKYNKEFLRPDLINTYGFLRSVIIKEQKVLCFAPPKSLSAEKFMLEYPSKNEKIIAEEFVEGTMINVFFDPTNGESGCWKIATRNTVGANVSFYKNSNMTFNQMFMEACIYNKLNIQCLNPRYCYSFVLQHPANRIVVPFKNSQLYLVGIYEIYQTDESIMVVEDNLSEIKNSGFFNSTGIKFPENYEFSTYTDLIEKFASGNTSYTIMGIVVKNVETGERTKFRNPIYEEIRNLRGNQPKLQYQYLCLRQSGKLSQYLKYYPESKNEMSIFRDQVHMFTENLHKNYISCYVKKTQQLGLYPAQYKTHMFKLHEHYINNLRPKGLYITNMEVINYVNKLHPSLLMYCLNYNMRKRIIDSI
jgi:hypothetical protein